MFFNSDLTKEDWIRNPFKLKFKEIQDSFSSQEKVEIINLGCDTTLKDSYKSKKLADFCLQVSKYYSLLSYRALQFLIPSTSSYQ